MLKLRDILATLLIGNQSIKSANIANFCCLNYWFVCLLNFICFRIVLFFLLAFEWFCLPVDKLYKNKCVFRVDVLLIVVVDGK